MGENLLTALGITVAGMGLVFGAIILLWLVMIALVRFTAEQAETETQNTEDWDLKRRVAIAAVVTAMVHARSEGQPEIFPLPPTAIVTPWQAVQRGRLLSQKGPKK